MKKYNITVNGKTYEVEVEEVGEFEQVSVARPQATPTPTPQVKKEVVPEPEIVKEVSQAAETINSPMPGSIFDIKVAIGDRVEEGDTLLILEAMKMENEIMSPRNGKIVAINTSKGASVDTGDPLISIE